MAEHILGHFYICFDSFAFEERKLTVGGLEDSLESSFHRIDIKSVKNSTERSVTSAVWILVFAASHSYKLTI